MPLEILHLPWRNHSLIRVNHHIPCVEVALGLHGHLNVLVPHQRVKVEWGCSFREHMLSSASNNSSIVLIN